MSDGEEEEEGGSCTWVHVAVFSSINACLQACGCVRAFMRAICSTSIQDESLPPGLWLPRAPHSASFHLFRKEINQVSG